MHLALPVASSAAIGKHIALRTCLSLHQVIPINSITSVRKASDKRHSVQGVEDLHEKKIVHRDIKPANTFIGKGDTLKIGDLGVAKILNKQAPAQTQIGTPHYMAPEVWVWLRLCVCLCFKSCLHCESRCFSLQLQRFVHALAQVVVQVEVFVIFCVRACACSCCC